MNSLKWLRVLLLFVIVFALQMTVVDWLRFFDIEPDLVIIFIVAVAIKFGPATGCFWGFFAGFTQDVYAPVEWLGAHSASMSILGFVVGQFEERFLTLNLPTKIGALAVGFLGCDAIYYFFTGTSKEIVYNLFLTKTVPECIYTMLIGGICFYLDLGKKKKKHV